MSDRYIIPKYKSRAYEGKCEGCGTPKAPNEVFCYVDDVNPAINYNALYLCKECYETMYRSGCGVNKIVIGESLLTKKYIKELVECFKLRGCDVQTTESGVIITGNHLEEHLCELEGYAEWLDAESWFEALKCINKEMRSED